MSCFQSFGAGTFGDDLIMSYQHGWKEGRRNNLPSHSRGCFGLHSDDVQASAARFFLLQLQIKEECHLMSELKLVI